VKFNEQVEFLFQAWFDDTKQTVAILGPPGIGKTAAGREVAQRMTSYITSVDASLGKAVCEVVDLSSCMPEDILGLPWREESVTKYCPPEWLHAVCDPKAYGVLILDDLPAASTGVQVAARQISLERRVHGHKISDRILVLVTGNRREDKSAASTLPAHFRNSVLMLQLQPDLETWMNWYGEQKGYDDLITSYLQWRVGNFSKLPKDADQQGSFATPRTWSMLGKMCKVAKKQGVLFDVASGLVGEGCAVELVAFDKMRNSLVSPAKVLENPQEALPDIGTINSPDRMVAMVTGIAELSANRGKANQHVSAFLKALAYITRQNNEYVAVGINTYRAKGGSPNALIKAIPRLRESDENVAEMVKTLREALS
tara:strand:+ start:3355 stop:4464 length:1110 start_codon:yes stop_codon:yes gene_type:complete